MKPDWLIGNHPSLRNCWNFADLLNLEISDDGGPTVWINDVEYWRANGLEVEDYTEDGEARN